jgi:phage shock protein C
MNTSRRLTRSNTDRIIGGVAGGIASYLNMDPTLVRLVFVLLVLVGGVSPFIYLILWAVLPNETSSAGAFPQQVRENLSEIQQRATQAVSKVSDQVSHYTNKDQANQVGQSSTPSTQSQPDQGPSTGPTTRL